MNVYMGSSRWQTRLPPSIRWTRSAEVRANRITYMEIAEAAARMFGWLPRNAKEQSSDKADYLVSAMTAADKTLREQLEFIGTLQNIQKGEYDTGDPRFLVAQAHFLHALLVGLLKDNRVPEVTSLSKAPDMLLTNYLITRNSIARPMANAIVAIINDNMDNKRDAYSKMARAARDALNDPNRETACMQFAIAIHFLITDRLDADYDLKPCCFNISSVRALSLKEFFATFGPPERFIRAERRAQDDERLTAALFRSLKVKWEDQPAGREAQHDLVRSVRPHELARARENFLKVKSKAGELLARIMRDG